VRSAKLLLLYVARTLGLFRLARLVTRRELRILCYHGFQLADEASFRPQLFISRESFERRIAALRRSGYRVLALDEAIDRLYRGTLPEHCVVITVDDGFHSFAKVAVPRLASAAMPATVYVTSYYVAHPNPVFRLAVQYMFWKTRVRRLAPEGLPWSDGRSIELADPAERARAVERCIEHGERRCSEDERRALCRELGARLEVPYEDIVASGILSLMRPEELRRITAAGVAVELHTHRHHFPADDLAAAEREIRDNRAALAAWVDGERRHFCYPSGEWDERHWPCLDALGIASATTCIPGLNNASTPRHALRRFLDGEHVHQLEFEAALCGFSTLVHRARGAVQ